MYSNQVFLGQGLQFLKVVGPVEVENAPYGANSIHVDVPAQSVDGKKLTYLVKHTHISISHFQMQYNTLYL